MRLRVALTVVVALCVLATPLSARRGYLTSLVSYWELDEASGNALDVHGTNELTDNNTVTAATGKVSGARDFESTNSEFFSLADNASISTGDIDFSFAVWVNLESLPTSGGDFQILTKDKAGGRDYSLDYLESSGQGFRFYIDGGGGGFDGMAATGVLASAATWYFICGGHDATANVVWVSVDAGTPVTDATAGVAGDSDAVFQMGAREYVGFRGFLDGLIDNAAFWKKDIRADVSWLYNAGAGRSYADLVAADGGGSAAPCLRGLLGVGCDDTAIPLFARRRH